MGDDAVVRTVDLRKDFGPVHAVRGVSIDVAPGETFGFLGPNGAGKTTTIAMLCTLLQPTAGTAYVAGLDVGRHPAEVRRQIGLVFQDPTVDNYLTAAENLRFHAELYGLDRSVYRTRSRALLEMVELWGRRNDLVRTFSGGMRRRLEIARGLLHAPRVLFLDEPTIGLDPQTRAHIWSYIRELRDREGTTIFLTTHHLDEAENCDRIAIIDDGVIVAYDSPESLKAAVGQDRVELTTTDDDVALGALSEQFGIAATRHAAGLTFHVAHGEQFVPRLVAELGVVVTSIRVSRPTLDDVFMEFTGHTIRDAEASSTDLLRAHAMGWIRR